MKRFLRFKHWNKNNNIIRNNKKTIGIAGVGSNYGVTHISVSLANYIHSVLKKQVIYIELRDKSDMLNVVGTKGDAICGKEAFLYKGVNYILACSSQSAMDIMAATDAWIVVDTSSLDADYGAVYLQCETKIMIGSMQPWKRKYYYERLRTKDIRINMNNIKFYDTYKNKRKMNEFRNLTKQQLRECPHIENPFSLQEKEFEQLNEMIT